MSTNYGIILGIDSFGIRIGEVNMMKKCGKTRKYYFLVLLVLIVSWCSLMAFTRNVMRNVSKVEAYNLENDAKTYTSTLNSMLKDHLHYLQQVALNVQDKVGKESVKTMDTLLAKQQYVLGKIEIVDLKGNKMYGEDINADIAKDSSYEKIVKYKDAVICEDLVKEKGKQSSILLCAPVVRNDKTVAIVLGTVSTGRLNDYMDRWGRQQDGCAFLMDQGGDYLSRGVIFSNTLSKNENSFFTHLSNSNIENNTHSSDIEQKVKERRHILFSYRYKGDDYIASLCPISAGKWYMGYIIKTKFFYTGGMNLSQKTVIWVAVALILWIIWGLIFVYMIHKNKKDQESLERYALIDRQEKSIIFELQFSPKRLQFFGDCMEMLGQEAHTLRGEEIYDVYDYIHKDDASIRGRLHEFYDTAYDDSVFSAEVRIANARGEYRWFRVSGMIVRDENYNIVNKFVGKIENADQQIVTTKNLVQRAENDLLTGILNKKTMESKVTESLEKLKGNIRCIFFMVDLDNFKNVNDNLGHIMGDQAIVDTARALEKIFPEKAYIGRLGGDEFAVCVTYDAFDEESLYGYVKKKAEKVCEANRRTYANAEKEVQISSSVGIAIAPDMAKDFKNIYEKADNALYQTKTGGKNGYHIYGK